MTERTLVLIKPDGVACNLVGDIIGRIERKGLTLVALELKQVSDGWLAATTPSMRQSPSSIRCSEFITSGPLVAAVVEGPRAIAAWRQIAGGTGRSKAVREPFAATSRWSRRRTWFTVPIRPNRPSVIALLVPRPRLTRLSADLGSR